MSDQTLGLSASAHAEASAPADSAATAANLTGALVLEAPKPVVPVASTQTEGSVPLSEADRAKLDSIVARYLDSVSSLETDSQWFSDKVKDIAKIGDDDVRASAAFSNRLLEKLFAAVENGGLTKASTVSNSLLALRRQLESLDPATQGDLLSPRKLLGLIPLGDRLRDYFDKYRSSQHQLEAVITGLYHGQDELQRDNAAIEQEKVNLWTAVGRLRHDAYLAQQLDEALAARVASIEAIDPERAEVLKEDVLVDVHQKHQDLLTQLAVSLQGYLALDVIRRSNLELIKGVQRTTTTTVSALRTAVIVAQALADQELELDQVTALNATTSNLIESTSELLRQQSTLINEQGASSTVELDKLQAAFQEIYATLDAVDTFKVAALDSMHKTVSALSEEITRSQANIDRARAR